MGTSPGDQGLVTRRLSVASSRSSGLLGALWRPPPDRRQPDLFQDSPDTALVHDLATALGRQRPDAARLALALGGRAWDPANPELHASRALARAGDFAAARQVIEAEAGWQYQADLLAWHAHCCWQAGDQRAARRDWLGLCWRHPESASRVLDARDLPDRDLALAWQRFGDLESTPKLCLYPSAVPPRTRSREAVRVQSR